MRILVKENESHADIYMTKQILPSGCQRQEGLRHVLYNSPLHHSSFTRRCPTGCPALINSV